MKKAVLFVVFFSVCSLMAQGNEGESQRAPKSQKGQLTVRAASAVPAATTF
jgi:hypothetical protein